MVNPLGGLPVLPFRGGNRLRASNYVYRHRHHRRALTLRVARRAGISARGGVSAGKIHRRARAGVVLEDEAQPGNLVSFGAVEARRKGQKRMESGQSGRAPENPDNPYETLAPGGALGCRDDGARDRT